MLLRSTGTKAIFDDEYDFSKQSLYKWLKAIAPYQNMLGITNLTTIFNR